MRGTRAVALLALVAASLLCSAGTASATITYRETAKIGYFDAYCGREFDTRVIGEASFARTGNLVRVTYTLKHGEPEEPYLLSLWYVFPPASGECEEIGEFGSLETNAKGQGSATGELEVPAGARKFFAAGLIPPFFYNDSYIVQLP